MSTHRLLSVQQKSLAVSFYLQCLLFLQTKTSRDESYATTINFENHAQQWDKETLQTERALRADARKVDKESKPKEYTEYAGPVQDTYDTVVNNTLALLRGFTLDERTNRLRTQQQKTEVSYDAFFFVFVLFIVLFLFCVQIKKKKAQKGQFAPLKDEFQQKAAFDYLK